MILLELAERCEAATGPDPRIDAEVVAVRNNAMVKPYPPQTDFGPGQKWQFWSLDGLHFLANESHAQFKVLPVTASIDAALTLVPEGWLLQGLMERNASGQHNWRWKADLWRCLDDKTVRGIARVAHAGKAAPALAICAAALRARAAT